MKVVNFGDMNNRADSLVDPARDHADPVKSETDAELRKLLQENRLDEAGKLVISLLDQRIANGDSELSVVVSLMCHYQFIISRLPPLWHTGSVPLRPDSRLYACFDEFIELIRTQQNQIGELQSMIAELF